MGRRATVVRHRTSSPPSKTLERAVAAHRAGRLGDAEQGYHTVLVKHPRHADAWHGLGAIARERGEHRIAEELIQKALGFGAGAAVVWNDLGLALAAQNRLDEAVRAYMRALAVDPRSAQTHVNLATALSAQERFQDAAESYRRAIALDAAIATSAQVHNSLGCMLERAGARPEALGAFLSAIVLDPTCGAAQTNLDSALAALGFPADAEVEPVLVEAASR